MAKSGFLSFLDGYEDPRDKGEHTPTGKRFFSRTLTGSITPAIVNSTRRRFAEAIAQVTKKIQYITAKAYGAMSLAFGLVTIILSFLEDYGSATGEAATISFVIGVAFALISIPLLLNDEPLVFVFQDVRALDAILFDFLCINRVPRAATVKPVPVAVMAVTGVLLALLGYFIPVWNVIFIFCAVVFVFLAFGSPEFSFFSTIFVLPFISVMAHGEMLLLAISAITFISFVRKVISGKRVFSFEQYDLIVLIMSALALASGIFVDAEHSFVPTLVAIAAAFSYFIASNLVTNRRLADCMLMAVAISSVLPTIDSYYLLVRAAIDGSVPELISGGISSTFATTEIFAVFLLVSLSFLTALTRQSHGFARMLWIIFAALELGALVMCAEPFALAALILGAGFYNALKLRNAWTGLITVVLFLLLPAAVLAVSQLAPGISFISDIASAWIDALSVLKGNLVLGVGMGEDSVVGASNIFIETGLRIGVFALVFFVILFLVRIRHRTVYHGYIRHSQISKLSPSVAMATFAIVCYGVASSIIVDPSSHYLFWCVFGAGSATLRIAKKDHDDRVLYFEDTIDRESSVVDVKIV